MLLCAFCLAAAIHATAQTASYVYEKVTSEDGLVAGETYLIAHEGDNTVLGYKDTNNRKYCSATATNGIITIATNKIATSTKNENHAYELTLGGESGAWTFYDKVNGGYLYAASTKSNYLKTKANLDDNGKATITFTDEGNATIKFTGDKTHNVIKYNDSKNSYLYSCYLETSNQEPVQLYRKKKATFSISAVGYATLYLEEAFEMPEGVTGYTVTTTDYKSININDLYKTGSFVPAKTALLIEDNAHDKTDREFAYNVLSYEAEAPTNNLLHGSTTDAETYVENSAAYYKLAYDEDSNEVGFYWGAANGEAFTNGANKAYLALPSQSGSSPAKGFAFTPHDGSTAVNTLPTVSRKSADTIYDLNGRSLSTLNGAKKGVYIVNGKKTLVK